MIGNIHRDKRALGTKLFRNTAKTLKEVFKAILHERPWNFWKLFGAMFALKSRSKIRVVFGSFFFLITEYGAGATRVRRERWRRLGASRSRHYQRIPVYKTPALDNLTRRRPEARRIMEIFWNSFIINLLWKYSKISIAPQSGEPATALLRSRILKMIPKTIQKIYQNCVKKLSKSRPGGTKIEVQRAPGTQNMGPCWLPT